MDNYREKMREYLKEPNEYSSQYGKWGILNSEQRKLIRRLLDEMDSADTIIKKQYEEKQQLISFIRDKIQENKKEQIGLCSYESCYSYREGVDDTLNEVLDFVNKGGKDE